MVAACNATLLTGEAAASNIARDLLDRIIALGERRPFDPAMSLLVHFVGPLAAQYGEEIDPAQITSEDPLFVVPYRHNDDGWFDYQPMLAAFPIALWCATAQQADDARIVALREKTTYPWQTVIAFRDKGDAGHEEAWLCFLRGENDDYPTQILRASLGQVYRRVAQQQADDPAHTSKHIHHLQQLNPVTTEALVQLMLGAPQPIYNGGLLLCRVCYFDGDEDRPGLPADVAALVRRIDPDGVVLDLMNLSAFAMRRCIVQAGAFAEHRIEAVTYTVRDSAYPGKVGSYRAPRLSTHTESRTIAANRLCVELPPATQITLTMQMTLYAQPPTLRRQPCRTPA